MLKNFSDEALSFISAWISVGLVFLGLWGTLVFLHFKWHLNFAVTTDPKSGWDYFFNIAFTLFCAYLAGWVIFSLIQIGCRLNSFLLKRKHRLIQPSNNVVNWLIFLALALLVYIEGKGKLW